MFEIASLTSFSVATVLGLRFALAVCPSVERLLSTTMESLSAGGRPSESSTLVESKCKILFCGWPTRSYAPGGRTLAKGYELPFSILLCGFHCSNLDADYRLPSRVKDQKVRRTLAAASQSLGFRYYSSRSFFRERAEKTEHRPEANWRG